MPNLENQSMLATVPATATPATAPIATPATKPVPAKAKTIKRGTKAAKPVAAITAEKPDAGQAAKAEAQSAKLATKAVARKTVSAIYNGASLSVHLSNRDSKIADIIARVKTPIQQIANSPTMRDGSFAVLCAGAPSYGDVAGYLAERGGDLGAISRLASVGALAMRGDKLAIATAKLRGVIVGTRGAAAVPAKLKAD